MSACQDRRLGSIPVLFRDRCKFCKTGNGKEMLSALTPPAVASNPNAWLASCDAAQDRRCDLPVAPSFDWYRGVEWLQYWLIAMPAARPYIYCTAKQPEDTHPTSYTEASPELCGLAMSSTCGTRLDLCPQKGAL